MTPLRGYPGHDQRSAAKSIDAALGFAGTIEVVIADDYSDVGPATINLSPLNAALFERKLRRLRRSRDPARPAA